MPPDTVMLTIRLPRSLRDAFLEAARRDDLSASQILRKAIRSYLGGGESTSRPAQAATTPTPASMSPVTGTHEESETTEGEERDVEADLDSFIQGIQKMCGGSSED